MSSMQVDTWGRGFSYAYDAPLDMRMDPDQELTAEEIVNTWDERRLARLLREYGEERYATQIGRAIGRRRRQQEIASTQQLVDVIKSAVPIPAQFAGGHPARRTFQALRIAVNDELAQIEEALPAAWRILAEDGRLAAISFHSLEDRLVKRFLAARARGCVCPPELPICVCGHEPEAELLTRRAVAPTAGRDRRQPEVPLRAPARRPQAGGIAVMTPAALTPAAARQAARRPKPKPASTAAAPAARTGGAPRTSSAAARSASAAPRTSSARSAAHRTTSRSAAASRRASGPAAAPTVRPRRVSGPARPQRAPRRAAPRPTTRRRCTRAHWRRRPAPWSARCRPTVCSTGSSAGRAWIPILGVLLAGIVAMQVEILKLSAGTGRSLERVTMLQSRNEQLRADVAVLGDDQRIERLAAGMGMVMPGPSQVRFLSLRGASVGRALSAMRTPSATTFLAGLPVGSDCTTAPTAGSTPDRPGTRPRPRPHGRQLADDAGRSGPGGGVRRPPPRRVAATAVGTAGDRRLRPARRLRIPVWRRAVLPPRPRPQEPVRRRRRSR